MSYYAKQIAADVDNGHYFAPAFIDVTNKPEVFALGPLIGYQAGSAILKFYYTGEIYARDTTLGQHFWLNASIKF